jgi:uncharacterized protein (DUF2062 family)
VNETPQSDAAATGRTSWQRHVIDPIAAQLTQGITPEKVALTLAVGSALALFPILGTTTLLCLLAGILLRLNQPIMQMINALCAPVHLPVIYCMIRLGNRIFHVPSEHMGIRMMNHMLWDDPREFLEKFGMTALHAILAWSIIAPFWVLIIFLFSLPVLREAFRRRTVVVAQTTPNPPPVHPVP